MTRQMEVSTRKIITVTAVCLAALVGMTSSAGAVITINDANGNWCHLHTRNFPVYNGVGDGTLNQLTQQAIYNWDNPTLLSFPYTGDQNNAAMRIWDGYYGATGWAGIDYHNCHGWNDSVYLNKSYMTLSGGSFADLAFARAVACQETGHSLGLNHAPGDCMGAGYFSSWSSLPSADTTNWLNWAYPATGH